MTVRERDVEAYLKQRVERGGGVCWKWTGQRGVPDRVVVLPAGRVVFVEVKTTGGKLSALQRKAIKTLEALGAEVAVVWPKEDVDALLAFTPY